MELKKPCNINEQIDTLINHGIIINDKLNAYSFLQNVNYYRFTGCLLQFRVNQNDSNYTKKLNFEDAVKIYDFDTELRNVYKKYIEEVEMYFRTKISYTFSLIKCTESPHDQHYDENNFYDKVTFNEIKKGFENEEEGYYKDSLIVKHHRNKYDDKMPLWVLVELMSFSKLSKLYSCMYYSEKDAIAQSVGTGRSVLENHLHCLTIFRNKCAHGARLYNTSFSKPAIMPQNFLRANPSISTTSLFSYTLVLEKRLPDKDSRIALINDLNEVIDKYKDYIDLSLIGFPELYSDIMKLYC